MILESSLDNLVKDIRGNELMDIRPREVRSERLEGASEGVGWVRGARAKGRDGAHDTEGVREGNGEEEVINDSLDETSRGTLTVTSPMMPYCSQSVP
jgi:hypothetical protein